MSDLFSLVEDKEATQSTYSAQLSITTRLGISPAKVVTGQPRTVPLLSMRFYSSVRGVEPRAVLRGYQIDGERPNAKRRPGATIEKRTAK